MIDNIRINSGNFAFAFASSGHFLLLAMFFVVFLNDCFNNGYSILK